jgi:hypothetical protein
VTYAAAVWTSAGRADTAPFKRLRGMNPSLRSFVCLSDSKPTLEISAAAAHGEPGCRLVRWATQS